MKYFKKSKFSFSKLYLIVFITLISILSYINKDLIYRSAVTINLGSLYVNLLNEKAEIIKLVLCLIRLAIIKIIPAIQKGSVDLIQVLSPINNPPTNKSLSIPFSK